MDSLTISELISELEKAKNELGDLPVIVTREGKNHQYSIKKSEIYKTDYAYFGNDRIAWNDYGDYEGDFLNIGVI